MIKIPTQLQNPEFRFVLLGKWDDVEKPKGQKPKYKGKAPFEQAWQTKNNYAFDNLKLLNHQNNFGVIGGYGRLRILDIDDIKLGEEFEKQLDTFTVKTGGGGRHFYFISDYETNHVLINELGELRANNYQVVSAPCKHPSGNYYEIIKDIPIAEISSEDLLGLIKPYLREEQETTFTKQSKGQDTSKSGLEYRKIIALLRSGKERKEIYEIMDAYSKWASADDKYRNLTFEKAEDFVLKQGNTARVFSRIGQAEAFIEDNPLFYDKGGMWWKWNLTEYKYEIVDEVDILNSVLEELDIDTVNSKIRAEILNALKQEGRRNIPAPINPNWIQFKEEIFDIETGKQFKATPKYFVTNPIPHKLHNDSYELTPKMDKIFEEWVGKDYVKTLYEIIAYCLIPAYPIHRMFCFIGGGMNGKSKFLELLRKFLGKDNVCSTELDTLINSRFEITRLHKKLVCQMGETNFNEMSKTSIIKKLTGDDLIGFEYKNKTPFEDKSYAKILIATNSLPTTTDKTLGFYRRWLIVDFPNKFSEKKDILMEIPDEEYEALALKCTHILHDLLEKRRFHNEGTVEERMERYEAKSDFLQKFLDEFTEEKVDEHITKVDFRKKFLDWCKENRHRELAEQTLSKKLKAKGIEAGRKYADWLYDGKGGQIRVYLDIKWRD